MQYPVRVSRSDPHKILVMRVLTGLDPNKIFNRILGSAVSSLLLSKVGLSFIADPNRELSSLPRTTAGFLEGFVAENGRGGGRGTWKGRLDPHNIWERLTSVKAYNDSHMSVVSSKG